MLLEVRGAPRYKGVDLNMKEKLCSLGYIYNYIYEMRCGE